MQKLISIDFETYLISEEYPSPKPVCISYTDGFFNDLTVGMEGMEAKLRFWLERDFTIIAHNASFEANVIFKWFPNLTELLDNAIIGGRIVCTKVNEMLIDCTRKKQLQRYSLDALVKHYFQVDISDDKHGEYSWRLRYAELENVPLEAWPIKATEYAINDSIWALKIYKEQLKSNIKPIPSVQADIYLNYIGQFGINVDLEYVKALESEVRSILEPSYQRLINIGLCSLSNVGKVKKNVGVLQKLIGENVDKPHKAAKGGVSTSTEDITDYLKDPTINQAFRDALDLYLAVIKYEKVLTTFIARLRGTSLIRSQYRPVVSTGRTSSSTSSFYPSVNIQQMPRELKGTSRDVRGCFIPRPGYKICSIDYSGLELSCTAFQLWKETGKRDMLNIINGGDKPVDMHSMLAYRLYNISKKGAITYDNFIENKKLPEFKAFRQLAKPINLGFPGGIGYDTMRSLLARDGIYPALKVLREAQIEDKLKLEYRQRRGCGESVRIRRIEWNKYQLVDDELVRLKQELFNLYPDLEYFLKEGHKGYLTGSTKPMLNEFNEWEDEEMYKYQLDDKFSKDWCTYTMVCNGLLMQSPAAIGAKQACVDIISKYKNSKECNILAFIHDEILFEVLDNDNMYDNIKDIATRMINEMQTVVPKVRIAVEAELMDRWMKSGGFWSKTYWRDAQ